MNPASRSADDPATNDRLVQIEQDLKRLKPQPPALSVDSILRAAEVVPATGRSDTRIRSTASRFLPITMAFACGALAGAVVASLLLVRTPVDPNPASNRAVVLPEPPVDVAPEDVASDSLTPDEVSPNDFTPDDFTPDSSAVAASDGRTENQTPSDSAPGPVGRTIAERLVSAALFGTGNLTSDGPLTAGSFVLGAAGIRPNRPLSEGIQIVSAGAPSFNIEPESPTKLQSMNYGRLRRELLFGP